MPHRGPMRRMYCTGCEATIAGLLLCGAIARAQDISLAPARVEVQIREVNLHLDRSTVLEIKTLRGQLVPTRRGHPVTFDDVNSFTTRINTAETGISLKTLSHLLNQ